LTNDDEPKGGVRLDMRFGETHAAQFKADATFKLVIVGDFGGSGDGRPRDISNEDISELMASFGAVVSLEVPNRLGSATPALAIRLPLTSVRDLDPKTLPARIPELAEAERLATAFAKGSAQEIETLTRETRPATATPVTAPAPRTEEAAHDGDEPIDRLLGMIDMPGQTVQPDAAKAAVSAFVSSLAKPRLSAAAPKPLIAPLVQEQVREVVMHKSWLATEAAWRSLRSIMAARGARAATRLVLCDVKQDGIAAFMHSEAFTDTFADAPDMAAILVVGAFDRTGKDLDTLDRVADAASNIGVPAIVSLAQDFFGVAPEKLAKMDNPRSLLEASGYGAWHGLRGREESRWLFPAWNDVVLRNAAGEAPVLWGEPGAILAAQILRSLARCGWPTEIIGVESAMSGLEVAEVELGGGRASAIPLRAAIDQGSARDLGADGILCLVCRPDRDQAWFTRAPSLHVLNVASDADRPAMERFNSLPFYFVLTFFQNFIHNNDALLSSGQPDDVVVASLTHALNDVLLTTGPGASAHVARVAQDDNGRGFEVTIRLGKAVMDGFSFSFEFAA
jgi:predicted component of type VI protein secretion system